MAQQLLDRAQIRSALQQMGRVGVPERVRVHRALGRGVARPHPQSAPHVGRREPPAGLREEQRRLVGGALQRGPAALEVARDGAQGGLPGGHVAGLGALAEHPQLLGVELDRRQVQVDQLLGPQPAAVGDLEQRAVAQLQRRGGGDPVQQLATRRRPSACAAGGSGSFGEASRSAGLARSSPCSTSTRKNARADASLRASVRGATPVEDSARRPAAQDRIADVLGPQALGGGPGRQLAGVDAVGVARALGRAAALQLAVEAAQGLAPRLRSGTTLGCDGLVLHRHRHRSGRHPAPAGRGRHRALGRAARRGRGTACTARRDASTMWYAVMRRQERGVFIGTLVLRHIDHHASLLEQGWEEVPVDEIAAFAQA